MKRAKANYLIQSVVHALDLLEEFRGTTDELGVYEVREGSGNKVTQQFAVNLFDTRESDLTPADEIEIGHEEVKAQQGQQTAREELWKWLTLGALGVLIFEWYIYNRRVYL